MNTRKAQVRERQSGDEQDEKSEHGDRAQAKTCSPALCVLYIAHRFEQLARRLIPRFFILLQASMNDLVESGWGFGRRGLEGRRVACECGRDGLGVALLPVGVLPAN